MMMFITLSILLSVLLFNASHPLAILILIMAQTVNLCLLVWVYLKISWFSYILFLIFIGGLMVLFMYITSLASNEKFEVTFEQASKHYTTIFLVLFSLLTLNYFMGYQLNMSIYTANQSMMIFSSPMIFLILIVMSYLLVTLIVAVKITSKFEGPLRSTMKKN